jgi:hypothetical protein
MPTEKKRQGYVFGNFSRKIYTKEKGNFYRKCYDMNQRAVHQTALELNYELPLPTLSTGQ